MNDELARSYHRWRALEQDERDDDADAAFGPVFRDAVVRPPVPIGFSARTMQAVAAAAARDERQARRTRNVLVPVGCVGAGSLLYLGSGWIVSLLTGSMVSLVDVLIAAIVGLSAYADAGADLWSIARGLGRAAAAFMSSPAVSISIIAIQGVAMAALIVLQRLLGSDGESYR